MDTTIKSYQNNVSANTNTKTKTKTANSPTNFWSGIEFNRFGIIPLLLVFMTCMGGIAVAYGAESDTLKLSMVVFPTIISLALVLAVAPMRLIIWASSIAFILDLLVFAF